MGVRGYMCAASICSRSTARGCTWFYVRSVYMWHGSVRESAWVFHGKRGDMSENAVTWVNGKDVYRWLHGKGEME